MTAPTAAPLPAWADALKRRYLAGEAGVFVLHGNVHDGVPHAGALLPFADYLHDVVLAAKPQRYELALRHGGLRRRDAQAAAPERADTLLESLSHLETRMRAGDGVALVLPHAGDLLPNAETTFLSTDERGLLEILHDWSLGGLLLKRNHIVVLLCASLAELHPSLNTNPRIAAIEVPLPDEAARAQLIAQSAPHMPAARQALVAKHTAGLRLLEVDGIVAERPAAGLSEDERKALALQLLGDAPDAAQRAEMYAGVTAGKTREEIAFLILGRAEPAAAGEDPLEAMLGIIGARKREIIQRSCGELIEFIDPVHGLDAVGGYDQIKRELMKIAATIRTGDRRLAPMGLLAVGPMGVGKTFVVKAFLKEAGLPGVVLKNFRSKWVGSTESNLERVLKIVRAMSPIALVIDEGDRSFGGGEGETDGGTSSRVIARIKDFMSDTANRGHVLTILMTNRPDKLDVDIKRPGRLDRKIPFFYADTAADRLRIVGAILSRSGASLPADPDGALLASLDALVGYSNADLEAIALLALDLARGGDGAGDAAASASDGSVTGGGAPDAGGGLTVAHLQQAIADFIPPQHADTIQLMELLAVQESSRRSLLPERFASLPPGEVSQLIDALKRRIR